MSAAYIQAAHKAKLPPTQKRVLLALCEVRTKAGVCDLRQRALARACSRTGAGKRSLPQIAYARLRADFAQREQHALLSGRQLRLVRRLYIGSAHATLLRRGLACT